MDRNQLWRLIHQKEKEFEQNKWKRALKSILIFAAVLFFVIFAATDFFENRSLLDIIEIAVLCLVYSGVNLFVNAPIFGYLMERNNAENKQLEDLKKQLQEVEKNDIY